MYFPFLCCLMITPCMGQMSPVEGAPEDFDQTIFAIQKTRSIGPVEGLALNFIKDQHR